MKNVFKTLKSKIKPRFTWWKGNYWDLGDALVLAAVVACLFPILPWSPRKGSNYLPGGKFAVTADVMSRMSLDVFDDLGESYKKKYPDEGLRKCKQSRDVVLSIMARDVELRQVAHAASNSNVAAIFFMENLILEPIVMSSIAIPAFEGLVLDVAKACDQYPGEFLDLDSAKRFYMIEQRPGG